MCAGLLRRERDTPPQVGLPRDARRTNVRDAFRATRAAPSVVWLVDDVRTTGATAHACASALSVSGAQDIHVITLSCAT